jgi:hypothetical protein
MNNKTNSVRMMWDNNKHAKNLPLKYQRKNRQLDKKNIKEKLAEPKSAIIIKAKRHGTKSFRIVNFLNGVLFLVDT